MVSGSDNYICFAKAPAHIFGKLRAVCVRRVINFHTIHDAF